VPEPDGQRGRQYLSIARPPERVHSAQAARARRGRQICSAAAIGAARLMIWNGAWPPTAATVRGHESVIQKLLNAPGVPLAWMKRV
jgi:hypothetical protein